MPQTFSASSTGSPPAVPRFAVIGAGITGLSAAQRILADHPTADVIIFEAKQRAGGIIHTIHEDDFLLELGPDSFITNKPAALKLCDEIGFTKQLIPTDNCHRRSLVLSNGKPEPVPQGFVLMAPGNLDAIKTTPVLSPAGRLRLLQESQIPPAESIIDESLADFVRRRFGTEALDRLVQPLVGGIYTSDPERLSIKATLPRFQQMEQQYGSVTAGALQKNRATKDSSAASGARYGLFAAPKNGMTSMVSALCDWLTTDDRCRIRLGTSVTKVVRAEHGWDIEITDEGVRRFDGVIVTAPTHLAAKLIHGTETEELTSSLAEIEYASSAIVVSTHRLADFEHSLEAFGLVIPMCENRNILAVSFSSRKFEGRAPEGTIILRTFVGGATQPHLLEHSESEIEALVNQELTELLGMTAPPMSSRVARYDRAMPQYYIGHEDRIRQIEQRAAQLSGLELGGSAYHGVGIPDSIASGQSAATRVLTSLSSSP